MIETEEQRRWWFATHPEYSWSRRGVRKPREGREDGRDDRVRPEDVDAYVDRVLPYADGPLEVLLRSVKRNFGTEGEPRKPVILAGAVKTPDDGSLDISRLGGGGGGGASQPSLRPLPVGGGSPRIRPTQAPQGGRVGREPPPVTDRFLVNPAVREQQAVIEKELEAAGLNPRDYRLKAFQGKFVAERNSTFDPYRKDSKGETNLQRMLRGEAPWGGNNEKVVMHHSRQTNEGPMIEMTTTEHNLLRRSQSPSQIDRPESRTFRENWWRARARSILER